jgi:16S rRNA (uracil1498-N3)-methyltransferase
MEHLAGELQLMSERFYLSCSLQPGPILLDGPEAHHLATVCRLRVGDEVFLFNGDGREYSARVSHVARREVALEIHGARQPEREMPFSLEVAAPLPKGDRSQFLVEKLTEIGVSKFVPLTTERSVVHPREGKREKLHRYVIEASKQCGRNVLMDIDEVIPWTRYVPTAAHGLRLLAHPDPARPYLAEVLKGWDGLGGIRIAVGPEGGLSDAEVALAVQHGWQGIDLGPRILRVETAAIVLAAQVIILNHRGTEDTEKRKS